MDVRSQNLTCVHSSCVLLNFDSTFHLLHCCYPSTLFPSILKSFAFTSVRLARHASKSSADFGPESDPERFREHNLSTHLGFLAVVSWRRCRRKYCWNRLLSWWFQRCWHGNVRVHIKIPRHVPRPSRDGSTVLQVVFCGQICAQATQTSYRPGVHLTKCLVSTSSH